MIGALWILRGKSQSKYRQSFLKMRSEPQVPVSLRQFVLGYSWLPPRGLTLVYANSEARFASRAR